MWFIKDTVKAIYYGVLVGTTIIAATVIGISSGRLIGNLLIRILN